MFPRNAFGALLGSLLIAGTVACSDPVVLEVEAEPVRAIKYQVLGEDIAPLTRKFSGHIQARELSQLSFQVAGQVIAVHVSVGDKVQRGDLIAELDPEPYEFRMNTVEAELSSAHSVLRERSENFRSQQRVFKQSYISKSELDRAKAEYEKAQSAVKLAESRLKLAQRDLQNTRLLAPFTGTINLQDVEPFEDVVAARSVFEIHGTAGFEVALLLPSHLSSTISRGTVAVVAIPALDLHGLVGAVTEMGVRANSRGAFPVNVGLEDSATNIQAGMTAEVTLTLENERRQLLLPGSAIIVDGQGRHYVYVFDPSQSVVNKRQVETHLVGLDSVAIQSGASVGDIICVAGVEFLRDGQRVTLYESAH